MERSVVNTPHATLRCHRGRRRDLRDRCRATTCRRTVPAARYAILEGRPDIGGTWDLFRYPGVRSDSDMHTLGYSFKPWTAAKSIADGPSILVVPPRDRGRVRHRPPHPLRPPGRARRVVDRRRPLDHHRHAGPTPARSVGFTCGYLFMCSGLLQLQGRLHARVPGHRELRRAGRAPAGVAGRPRLRRQAGRRHRLRRHRRHAGAGDGRRRRARHDAAALADLRGLAPRPGRDRQHAAQGAPRRPRLRHHPLQEHHAAAGDLQADAVAARRSPRSNSSRWSATSSATTTTSTPISRRRYYPWDQRLCLVPNSDLFDAIKSGKASVVTDTIDTFTPTGITLHVRRRTRGRHRRHRHRPAAGDARRDGLRGRR